MILEALAHREDQTPAVLPVGNDQDIGNLTMDALLSLYRKEVEQGRVEVPMRILGLLKERGPGAEPALPILMEALEGSLDLREEAMQALEAMGRAAMLALVRECRRDDDDEKAAWSIRTHLMSFTPPVDHLQAYKELLGHTDERVRVWAAVALANLEEPGINAVVEMIRSEDPETRLIGVRAALAFTEYEDFFAPNLAPFLDDEDPFLRRAAAFTLGRLTPSSMHTLIEALSHRDGDVRRIAAEALERSFYPFITGMTSGDRAGFSYWHGSWTRRHEIRWMVCEYILIKKGIPALAAALRDESEEVRTYAAMALYKLGPIAGPVVLKALEEVLEDSSPVFSYWARRAHERVSSGPWNSLRLLGKALGVTESRVKLTEEELNSRVDRLRNAPEWKLTYDEHGECSWPGVPDQRWDAALSLLLRTLPILLKDEAGPDTAAAEKAREILKMLDRELSVRIKNLIRIMDDEMGRGPATSALARLGSAALSALEHDFLRCPRFPIGPPTYEELLWVLDQNGTEALPILVMGLEHWWPDGRYLSTSRIQRFGKEALPAVPALISAWRYDFFDRRAPGSDLFWDGAKYGTTVAALGTDALPWLERALEDDLAVVRARACRNVGAFGAEARPLLPFLLDRLEDPEKNVKREVARAILEVAPAGDQAFNRAKNVLDKLERN
jgi:HEAT repeat protein